LLDCPDVGAHVAIAAPLVEGAFRHVGQKMVPVSFKACSGFGERRRNARALRAGPKPGLNPQDHSH
jgi:hypothetical protein